MEAKLGFCLTYKVFRHRFSYRSQSNLAITGAIPVPTNEVAGLDAMTDYDWTEVAMRAALGFYAFGICMPPALGWRILCSEAKAQTVQFRWAAYYRTTFGRVSGC